MTTPGRPADHRERIERARLVLANGRGAIPEGWLAAREPLGWAT